MGSKTIKLSMYAYCGHHARNGEVRVDYLRVDYFQGYAPTRWCKDWQYRVIIERAKHSAVRVTYVHITWAVSRHCSPLNQTET
jgi:hypothetical protein